MKLKSLKESGELYTTHSKTMATINNFAQDVIDNHTKTKDLSNSLFIYRENTIIIAMFAENVNKKFKIRENKRNPRNRVAAFPRASIGEDKY